MTRSRKNRTRGNRSNSRTAVNNQETVRHLCEAAHEFVDRFVTTKNCCVLATRILIDAAAKLGIEAVPMACTLTVWTDEHLVVISSDDTDYDAVDIIDEDTLEPGHCCPVFKLARGKFVMTDITTGQAERPESGIRLGLIGFPVPDWAFYQERLPGGRRFIEIPVPGVNCTYGLYPGNEWYKGGADWDRDDYSRQWVNQIVKEVEARRQDKSEREKDKLAATVKRLASKTLPAPRTGR